MKIKIKPVTTFIGSAETIEITHCRVVLGTAASVSFRLLDSRDEELHAGHLQMSQDEYALWGSDDNYVAEFLARKIGSTIIEVVSPYQGLPVDPSASSPQV